ncbi:MAG: DUF4388 domain-containing protein [Planctomycetota bacterium]|nr:MAG: DUF4388 domain-containing protein [Planctomycetota bacterium]
MPIRGRTKGFHLSDLMEILTNHQYSGTLRISWQNQKKVIYFKSGELHLLSWPQNKNIRIGSILVKQKKITESQLMEALAIQKGCSKKLGEILLDQGFLTEEDIHNAVKSKLEEEIYEIFTWEDGYFEFFKNHYPPEFQNNEEVTTLVFSVKNLLMEGLRRSDEWKILKEKISSPQLIFQRKEPIPSFLEESEEERNILNLIDGKKSVSQILGEAKEGRFEVYSILSNLLDQGVILLRSFAECQQAFYDALSEKDFHQAIHFLEAALVLAEEEHKEHIEESQRLINSLICHKDFASSSEEEYLFSAVLEKELLAFFIQGILLKKHRGVLVVNKENQSKSMIFDNESLQILDNTTDSYLKLGQILVRMGKIRQSDLDRSLTLLKLENYRGTLEEILLREKIITSKDLDEALEIKALEDLAEIFLWNRPFVQFYKNRTSFLSKSQNQPLHLIFSHQFYREVVENLNLWGDILKKVSHSHTIFAPASANVTQALDWEHKRVLELVNGNRNVEDLLQMASMGPSSLCRILYRLLNKGYIRLYSKMELDGKIDEALALKDPLQAIKYCQAAFELTKDDRYLRRIEEIQKEKRVFLGKHEEPAIEGDLNTLPVRELLQVLNKNKSTGTLALTFQKWQKMIFFREGNVCVLYLKNLPLHGNPFQISRKEAVFEVVPEDQAYQDILEVFYWTNARFSFLDSLLPEYFFFGETYIYEFDTQLLILEFMKQMEGFEFLCNYISSVEMVLDVGEQTSYPKDLEPMIRFIRQNRPTVLELFKRFSEEGISQFVLKAEEWIEEGVIKILEAEKCWQILKSKEYESLDDALKYYQHLNIIAPSPEVEEGIHDIMSYLAEVELSHEVMAEKKIEFHQVPAILEQTLREDRGGTFLAYLAPQDEYAFYISKHEIWAYFVNNQIDLEYYLSQMTGQKKINLKEARYYSEKKNRTLPDSLVELKIFPQREVQEVMENLLLTEMLRILQNSGSKKAYHPDFFPLSAREELWKVIRLDQEVQPFLSDLLYILNYPQSQNIPFSDKVIFAPGGKFFAKTVISKRSKNQDRSRGRMPSKAAFIGERDLRKLVDGTLNISEIVTYTRLPKILIWKLLLNLYQLEEIHLLPVQDGMKKAQMAYMANDFEGAEKYYSHILALEPHHPKVLQELERIQKYKTKLGKLS